MSDQAVVNAEELRKALDEYTPNPDPSFADPTTMEQAEALTRYNQQRSLIHAAARSWLSLLEGDEAVIRSIDNVIDAWAPDLNGYAVEQFTAELIAAVIGGTK